MFQFPGQISEINKVENFLGKIAAQKDSNEVESKARKKHPYLLESDEKVIFAFKDRGGKGRDSSCFTDRRIIIKDKLGFGKKTKWKSIPYDAIKAYSISSASKFLTDSELEVFAEGDVSLKMGFVQEFDIFLMKRILNEKVLVKERVGENKSAEQTTWKTASSGDTILELLEDDSSQVDAKEMEKQLKSNVLLPDESVEMAFKCGRDLFTMTSKRLLWIDVQELLTGNRMRYFTITWKCIRAFSVETAGKFDRDSELTLFTKVPSNTRINIDFRKGTVNFVPVQKFIADKILGNNTEDEDLSFQSSFLELDCIGEEDGAVKEDKKSGNIFAWVGDDNRMIDTYEITENFSDSYSILQGCELCEMAFRGSRDLVLFTTKRLISVNYEGLSGEKVFTKFMSNKLIRYLSIPWTTVKLFGVRSAGSSIDKDSEMMIWTDFDDTGYEGDSSRSYIELEFQKDKVDLLAIHRYLSERCLCVDSEGQMNDVGIFVPGLLPYYVPVAQEIMQPSPLNCVESFLNWLGDDAAAIDHRKLNEQLHYQNPMLQKDEHIFMSFKSGRGMMIFTSKRVFIIDKKGSSVQKILWLSVPYTSLRAFGVESAGSWDKDIEVKLYCAAYKVDGVSSVINEDLCKDREETDIIAIHNFLSHHVFGFQDGSTTLEYIREPSRVSTISAFLHFIENDRNVSNVQKLNKELHSSTPILQNDESIELAVKTGSNLLLFSTKRILYIDVNEFNSQKVQYISYPLRYCHAFKILSVYNFFDAPLVGIYTSIPGEQKN